MRNITYTLALMLTIFFNATAKQVEENTARLVGFNFMVAQNESQRNISFDQLNLIYKSTSNNLNQDASHESVLFYIFNITSDGFVIIAGDDLITPILGYSIESNYDPTNVSPSFSKWLENYKDQIRSKLLNHPVADAMVLERWNEFRNKPIAGRSLSGVGPLCQTRWNQNPYYNDQCPDLSVTGCVATGMAQVMKFWNYPAQGTGFHSYNHAVYGTLSANFGSTNYQWGSMPNNVTAPNSAVAKLMYHCGVSVDMEYSPESSGAYVVSSASPVTHCAEYALKNYFGYSEQLQGIEKNNYSETEWINILKNEFNSGRPVLYAGFGEGGGHCFVADGYDNNNFIHMNWGWGGQSDGFFTINDLDPNSLGSGGGSGGFNYNQQAVIGIQPPQGNQVFDLRLYDDLTPSSSTIYYGQAFNVSTNFANYGTTTFTGDFAAAIFNEDGTFIDFAGIITNNTLEGGYTYQDNLVFSCNGLLSMLPGLYQIGIYYSANGGDWVAVNDGDYENYVEVTVTNPNDIQLYSNITLTPGTTLTQGQPAHINLNILNEGNTTFTGKYSVGLFNLDGSLEQSLGNINESEGLPPNYTYAAPFLDFYCTAITAAPGSYYLAVQHKQSGSDTELTGSSYFSNPINVKVIAQALQQDQYEANNSLNVAYKLPVSFTNSNAIVNTTGSNCHNVSDNDFFKIELPAGYSYSLTPRLHDSYSSTNGNTYTLDALFSFSFNGSDWSDIFDDIMPTAIQTSGAQTIYFHVAPYYAGQTGTYLLSVPITRSTTIGWDENTIANSVLVYPNPATDKLIIDLRNFNGQLRQVDLLTAQGEIISSKQVSSNEQIITIPVRTFTSGLYLLHLITDDTVIIKKVIIGK
ncbi:MAG: thiol protease/hemagglutinin PrtT [Clostridiales bacterium]